MYNSSDGGTVMAALVFIGIGLLVVALSFIAKVLVLFSHVNLHDLLMKALGL